MARRPRIVIPGLVHHITQRGNHQQITFYSPHDQNVFLDLCAKYIDKYRIRLISYTLMSNHVHLALVPGSKNSLADGMGQLFHDFAIWQNIQQKNTGHLWQDRFYSAPVEEDRIGGVLGYIELNPVRAGMVKHSWEWNWSSARAHVTGTDPSGLLDMEFWKKRFKSDEWKAYLEKTTKDKTEADSIRYATKKGLFLGSEETAVRLERELGIQLRPKKRGPKTR